MSTEKQIEELKKIILEQSIEVEVLKFDHGMLNFEHKKPYCQCGMNAAYMVVEPSTSEACRRYERTKGS